MPYEADDLLYNYEGISSVSGAIEAFVAQMNANLDEVDAVFRNLLANGWGGSEGAAAFQAQSAKWHSGANEMAVTLRSLSTKVGDAGINMKSLDQSVANRFGTA
ncbi:WXG100 family type VII secretion target [Cryptosporangium minutisporangium]|uniref:ESAT-6-like protein n=1 Tax=Cryptosporangium minutisporangium TaxID=113569 RepID=A0ABP6TDD4_9ACTN